MKYDFADELFYAALFAFLFFFRADARASEGRVDVSFSAEHSSVTLHEPDYILLSIRNGLSEPIEFDLGLNKKIRFEFSIIDPDGKKIRIPRLKQEGHGLSGKLSLASMGIYTQRLLLNEWYQFLSPGTYTVKASLDVTFRRASGLPVGSNLSGSMSQHILLRDEEQLRRVCVDLTSEALGAPSLQRRRDAAFALDYVLDPVAVPFLGQVLADGRVVQAYGAVGLSRIGNEEAIGILISNLNVKDPELLSVIVLELRQVEGRTRDQGLRDRIKTALSH